MLQHNFSNWWRMAMAMARSQMQYRANFITMIVAMVLTYGGQFVSLYWLTQRFETVGGWHLEEIILLYAMAILAWGVCLSFFETLLAFEDQIRNGTFDRALLRPMNPLLHVLGSQSPLSGMGQLLFSLLAFLFAFQAAQITVTPIKLLYIVLTALGGGMIFGACMICIGAVAFWTTRTYTFFYSLMMPARQLIHYPISIYHRALQAVLTVAVPFAFINYFPAHMLLGRAGELAYPWLAWATPAVGLVAITAAYAFWRYGTRFYTGTGS